MPRSRALVPLLIALAAFGCQPGGPPPTPDGVEVSGKALLPNGSPLTGGTLVLRPDGGAHGATAQVKANGQFTLARPSGEAKVVPGKYRAYVLFNDPAHAALRSAINRRYQDTEDGDSDILIEITTPRSDLVVRFKK